MMQDEDSNNEFYILDNVMSSAECLELYHSVMDSPNWTISRQSLGRGEIARPFGSFPGLVVEFNGEIRHDFFSGYFRSLIHRIRKLLKQDHKLDLPGDIKRIILRANSSQSETEFHTDSEDKYAWTILGFLNPVWNVSDGGEFYIESEKIDYKSARFIVFKSHLSHNGGVVKNDKLNYWRVSLNIVLQDDSPDE